MSDDGFSDDDDEIFAGLGVSAKSAPSAAPVKATNSVSTRLYEADGEIAILRAQLSQLKSQKQEELTHIRQENLRAQHSLEEQVNLLKFSVQKLEDEKKFLDNQLKTTYAKRRKTNDGNGVSVEDSASYAKPKNETVETAPKTIKVNDDSSLLIDFLYKVAMNGSPRPTLSYLSQVTLGSDVVVKGCQFKQMHPLSSSIIEFILVKRDLRLDQLIREFCILLIGLIDYLEQEKTLLAVPFLLSLIHGALIFRVSAVDKTLTTIVSAKASQLVLKLVPSLDSVSSEETYTSYYNLPLQNIVLENLILICAMDVLEKSISIASSFDATFFASFVKEIDLEELISIILPRNTGRLVNCSQINVLFNMVQIVGVLVSKQYVSSIPGNLFDSLLKLFLIEVGMRSEYMFWGLNRMIGNNTDFEKVEAMIPEKQNCLGKSMMVIPNPIPRSLRRKDHDTLANRLNHEFHLLTLRIQVTQVIETFAVTKPSSEHLRSKETIKSLVRIANFEQAFVMGNPRSKYNYIRIQMISGLIRILYHLFDDDKKLNELLYPETLSELLVVLSRTSFSSDSLSIPAHKLLKALRQKDFKYGVFNDASEKRARELAHMELKADASAVADVECEMANGLEFPYDSETVEISRELLSKFINHDEADNLYLNMNGEEPRFDEMDIVDMT